LDRMTNPWRAWPERSSPLPHVRATHDAFGQSRAQAPFICTNGTSPLPAAISAARSASPAWRDALHQTCTRYDVRSIEWGVGRSCASGASGQSRAICDRSPPPACGPGGELAPPDGAALSPCPSPRLWQRDAGAERQDPRRSLTSDQFPASDVMADQRHVLVVGAPRASQITARRCAPTRFTDAASAARSILPDGRCWQTARSHWSEVP
jgi:hypothetical protein